MVSYIFFMCVALWAYSTLQTFTTITPFNSLLATFALTLGIAVIFQHHSEDALHKINEDILDLEYKCKSPIEITNTLLNDLEKIKYEYKLELQELKLEINELSMLNLNEKILGHTSNTELFNSEIFYSLVGVSIFSILCVSIGFLYFHNKNNVNMVEQINNLTENVQQLLITQESVNVSNRVLEEITLDFMQEISIETLEATQQIAALAISLGP